MKRELAIISLLGFSSIGLSQNVGIGTTNPLEKLSILTNYGYGISHEANSIKLSTYIDVSGAYIGTITNHSFNFFTNNGTAQMTLLPNGNVGISNSFPQFKMDITGRIRVKTGAIGNIFTTSGIWFEDYRDGNNRIFLGMQDSIRMGIWGDGTPGVGWAFNFNARDGRVGIGRVAGNYQLEVAAENGIGLSKNAGNSYYGFMSSNADTAFVISSAAGNSLGGIPAKNILLNPPPSSLFLYSGNVAIGTTSPTAKFHVNGNVLIGAGNPATGYTLSVNGKVICTEAKVQLNASWPDYVFGDQYLLTPLDELSRFIQTNKHLPNIPSAKVAEANGIELGDMVTKLLEKVEELTLYVIELKKENTEIKKIMLINKK
jgi:hypothetical protein